jgi:non-heme chloroperoxidase
MATLTVEPVRREYIEVAPGVHLHVRDWGHGRPIVLIHGYGGSNDIFDYQMTELAQTGFRAISISLRGYGRSDKPWGEYNYDIFADDIKFLVDQLGLNDVLLVGYSMGGAIAIRYMSRHDGRRVTKLALCAAAAPSWTKRQDYPFGFERSEVDAWIRGINIDRPQLFADGLKIFGRTETSLNPGLLAWLHSLGMQASPHALIRSLVALRDTDLRPELAAIEVPTTIFHGVGDKICPFAFAEEMANGIKKARVIRFENSGHGLLLEEKDKFNRELVEFAGERLYVQRERGLETGREAVRGPHDTLH